LRHNKYENIQNKTIGQEKNWQLYSIQLEQRIATDNLSIHN